MPEVEIWEAVALSLGIEPSEVKFKEHSWTATKYPFLEGLDFAERLDVIIANRYNRNHFEHISAAANPLHRTNVRLPEFVRFAVNVAEWDVPAELRALLNDMAKIENKAEEVVQLRGRVAELEAENASLKAKQAQPANAIGDTTSSGLTFTHSTTGLELVADVQARFLQPRLYDPKDLDSRPSKEKVVAWLRDEKRISGNLAEAIDRVAMPFERGRQHAR